MIQRNEDTGKYRAFCDCCAETSDEYDTYRICRHGIAEDGWKTKYNAAENELEHFCPGCRED